MLTDICEYVVDEIGGMIVVALAIGVVALPVYGLSVVAPDFFMSIHF